MSGLSARALICWTAHVLPSGSAKPKNVPPSRSSKTGDLAALDAPGDQLLAGGRRVGDDELQPVQGARRHLVLRRQVADDDRAAGAARGQLRDVHVLVPRVVVEVEADLVAVEGDRRRQVADRDDDDLEGPVHGAQPCAGGRAATTSSSRRS